MKKHWRVVGGDSVTTAVTASQTRLARRTCVVGSVYLHALRAYTTREGRAKLITVAKYGPRS